MTIFPASTAPRELDPTPSCRYTEPTSSCLEWSSARLSRSICRAVFSSCRVRMAFFAIAMSSFISAFVVCRCSIFCCRFVTVALKGNNKLPFKELIDKLLTILYYNFNICFWKYISNSKYFLNEN